MITQTLFILYANFPNGSRFALMAFRSKEKAEKHVERCLAKVLNNNTCSAMEMLGVQSLEIESLGIEDSE